VAAQGNRAFHAWEGAALHCPAHGIDIDAEGNGVLDAPRLYQLLRQTELIIDRSAEITFGAPGAHLYPVTFG
jgi:hypothetical protein